MPALRFLLMLVLIAITAWELPLNAQATASLELRIIDRGSGAPLPGARLIVAQTHRAFADADGWARLTAIPSGAVLVSVRHPSFTTEDFLIHVSAGAAIRDVVELAPAPIELPTLAVEAARHSRSLESRGFYRRRGRGAGTFLDRDDIDRIAGRSSLLPSALRTLSGVRLMPGPNGRGTVLTARRSGGIGGFGTCVSQIILNGMVMRPLGEAVILEDLVNLNDVEGMEWYRGPATTPPEFNLSGMSGSSSSCGTLVIWTRTGR